MKNKYHKGNQLRMDHPFYLRRLSNNIACLAFQGSRLYVGSHNVRILTINSLIMHSRVQGIINFE